MAASLTTTLRIPTTVAVVAPRRRSQLTVVRASASKSGTEHQEVAASHGRRGAMMMAAAAAATVATAAVSRSARAATCSGELGGWVDIENVYDPYFQELGKWAVMEHDKETGERVKFRKVVGGCQQVVAGMNYNLDIESMDRQKYVARLFVSLEKKRQLTDFVGPVLG